MKHKKSNFNVNYAEGLRDGATKNGSLLALQFEILRNCKEAFKNAPIMVYYQQRYEDYKRGFLESYWN
jgi:hypothetical protein